MFNNLKIVLSIKYLRQALRICKVKLQFHFMFRQGGTINFEDFLD